MSDSIGSRFGTVAPEVGSLARRMYDSRAAWDKLAKSRGPAGEDPVVARRNARINNDPEFRSAWKDILDGNYMLAWARIKDRLPKDEDVDWLTLELQNLSHITAADWDNMGKVGKE